MLLLLALTLEGMTHAELISNGSFVTCPDRR